MIIADMERRVLRIFTVSRPRLFSIAGRLYAKRLNGIAVRKQFNIMSDGR
jgi:hypothetical protein